MSGRHHLRLGTRGSLLAVAQSRAVAADLRRAHPQLEIELVRVETRGDIDLQTPLSSVHDAGFFSDSLDQALQRGDVDFVVHSRKDLGATRPSQLACAAMPPRENPRDVIVFRRDIEARLRQALPIRIGSSSVRRQVHVETFLRQHLPDVGEPAALEFHALRGAVDQRLIRIDTDAAATAALDGVVLALAGLARLWRDPDGRAGIADLLAGTRWMVLPLSICPTAPGQGALAIECRRDDAATRALLSKVHDPVSAAAVDAEFATLAPYPADLHGAVSATSVAARNLDQVLFTRGPDDRDASRLQWQRPPRPEGARPWCVGESDSFSSVDPASLPALDVGPVFVAHWRAATAGLLSPHHRIWVSGTTSWRRLAQLGLWVEGCGDHLGFDALRSTLSSEVLQLPALDDWTVLTRAGAETSWTDTGVGQVLGTYVHAPDHDRNAAARVRLRQATHCFWSSAEQFDRYRALAPADAEHACGNGKTARALRALGIDPVVFPSRAEWQAWLG
ncbi:MAG: hydroxymethylbilane synthase [Gammaproteobacteria bacterium]|nr:hydroxymethylbilane synthase [Gammaproteobacteria bacterium]